MLYIFDEIDKLSDDFPERCRSYLSAQRLGKAFSYRFQKDRKLSVAAYLLLRLALMENYGIDEAVVFSFGKNGKPFLRDYPGIHFNLSHCRNTAACVVSPNEVGVDVEEIIPVSDDLAKRVLTEKEFQSFKTAENPFLRFCEYWVIKESYLKKTGGGIGTEMTTLSAEAVCDKRLFISGEDYCCCMVGASGLFSRVHLTETGFAVSDKCEEKLCSYHF